MSTLSASQKYHCNRHMSYMYLKVLPSGIDIPISYNFRCEYDRYYTRKYLQTSKKR